MGAESCAELATLWNADLIVKKIATNTNGESTNGRSLSANPAARENNKMRVCAGQTAKTKAEGSYDL